MRLAERSLRAEPSVRPRPVSMFEPTEPSPIPSGISEPDDLIEDVGPAPRDRGPKDRLRRRDVVAIPAALPRHEYEETTSAHERPLERERSRKEAVEHSLTIVEGLEQTASVEAHPPRATPRSARVEIAEDRPKPVTERQRAPRTSAEAYGESPLPTRGRHEGSQIPIRAAEGAESGVRATPQVVAEPLPTPARREGIVAPLSARLRPTEPRYLDRPHEPRDVDTPETTVEVTIGRVEIRAVPQAGPAQRTRSASAVMTLDQYLKRRAEQGRE